MSTTIDTTFGEDPDYDKIITVKHGTITIDQWGEKYLTPEENAEWLEQDRIHEAVVHAAIAAGDCVHVKTDESNVQIKWRNQEVHRKWMNTIIQENQAVYSSYWDRYHAKMAELEQEKS
jgi:hypothetical protein